MAEILKDDFPKYEGGFIEGEPVNSPTDSPDYKKATRKKIIKAHDAVQSAEPRKIPTIGSVHETATIRPLGSGKFVEGIEIICRCGEKIVIHFDYE